jgi:hypothetical protein
MLLQAIKCMCSGSNNNMLSLSFLQTRQNKFHEQGTRSYNLITLEHNANLYE